MSANDDFDALLARLRVDKSPAGRGAMSYEDGGPVEDGEGLTDEQLDQLAAQDNGNSEGGGLTDDQLDKLAAQQGPQPEGAIATGAREAAHGAVPAAVGLATAGAGAELGAIAGAPLAPFTAGLSVPAGAIIGGAVAGLGGGYAASKAQEAALDATGLNDTEQRQANEAAHPTAAFVGGLAPQVATLKPAFSEGKIVERVLQGGIMGGLEAGQEAANGDVDPAHIAEASALGAVFPRFNRVGETAFGAGSRFAGRWKPGRPDTQGRPEEADAKADAATSEPPKTARGAAVEQPPPPTDTPSTGNPQSAPTRSSRDYPKTDANNPSDTGTDVTKGYMAPDIQSAMEALGGGEQNPAPAAPSPQDAAQQAPAPAPAAPAPPVQTRPPELAQEPSPARVDQNPVTDAFRAAGQPVPGETGKPAPAEQERAPTLASPSEVTEATQPDHSAIDEAASQTHPSPSDAQVEAENYQKGHVPGADVGLPGYRISTETERGGVRSSKPGAKEPWQVEDFPYHYGHILGTTGADGDPMDIAIDNTGNKKFIVDQLDANTGKFDEHKIFANTSDEARVRDLYNRGFTDGKGPERLGAITEVDTDGLKDFLKNGDETKPFNPTAETRATAIEPTKAVVQNAIDALGKLDSDVARQAIEHIKKMSGNEQAMAATKALKALQLRDGNAVQSEYATARTPSERPKIEGTNITARSKADADRKLAAMTAHQDVMDAFPPGADEKGMDKPSLEAMKDRVTAAVTDLDKKLAGNGYKPAEKTAPFLWAKAARSLAKMKNITPKRAAEFIAAEKQLRAGTAEDVANVRDTGKMEGNISRSRRGGDEAVANAEAAAARAAPFEVGHEEAEPYAEPTEVRSAAEIPEENTRQLDLDNPEDAAETAKILNEGMPQWKRDQAARDAADQAKTERLKAARLAKEAIEPPKPRDLASADHEDETVRPKTLVEKFRDDERGAVNLSKVLKDVMGDTSKAAGVLASAASKAKVRANEPKRFFARAPGSPQEDYARSLGDDLFKLHQADVQHKEDLTQVALAAPKSASDDAIFHARDAGDLSKLTPEQQKAYDDNVKPLLDQNDKLFEAIQRIDPDRLGPKVKNHIYRIAKEHVGGDKIAQTNQSPDPVEGRVSAIGTNPTGTGLERQFYALERQDGHRFVISTAPEGYTIWKDGKGTRVKDPNFSFKEGDDYKVGPNTFKMDQATVKEIEAHGRFENGKRAQYYHNPMLSAVLANAELGAIARHLDYLTDLKKDPAFRQWAQPPHVDDNGAYIRPKGKEGWTETALQNFHDWKMDPQLAHTLDDYAAPGWNSRGLEALQNVANAATKSIFLLPFAHINNVAAHWFVGRGWDWIKPTGYRNMMVDGMQAVKSVIKQDDLQRQLRDSGASTLYGGVLNRDFIQNVAKAVGQDIEKNPERWGKIVKTLGMNKPADLVSAMYQNSSKAMWMVNDMFLTQAVLENQRKGMSMEGAINAVQKHIPAYRVPTQIGKPGPYGRVASQTMQASLPFVFGRYHYAMWNSWANIVKDIVGKEDQGAHRVEAVGQLMAAGALLFMYSYPLKKLAETITGNKEASFHPRGPATIPMALMDARRTGDVTAPLKSTLTTNPLFANAQETIANKDFGGRPIVEPGTGAAAAKGSPKDMLKVAGEEAEHAVRGFVSPYNTAADAYKAGRNPGQVLRDQVLDIKNPSPKSVKWMGQQPVQQNRQVQYRQRNPHGPLEALLDRFLK